MLGAQSSGRDEKFHSDGDALTSLTLGRFTICERELLGSYLLMPNHSEGVSNLLWYGNGIRRSFIAFAHVASCSLECLACQNQLVKTTQVSPICTCSFLLGSYLLMPNHFEGVSNLL
jgi:hypothetical protein